jgi:hypothetical protein
MKRARAFMLAAALALPLFGGAASAQNPASIQESCREEGAASWQGANPEAGYGRVRDQMYTNCMMRHGLRP